MTTFKRVATWLAWLTGVSSAPRRDMHQSSTGLSSAHRRGTVLKSSAALACLFQWPVVVLLLALTNIIVGLWAAVHESYFILAIAALNSVIVTAATTFHSLKRN